VTAAAALSVGAVLVGPAAAVEPAPRPPALTSAQERTVLRLIDDICADTWCEGDHALRFTRFSCSPRRASCTLRLQGGVLGAGAAALVLAVAADHGVRAVPRHGGDRAER
jgi:hypothetical protein